MDRPTRLADLRLVNKYYPVNNYSYPRPDGLRQQRPGGAGRSSIGSDCSAPGMVDDHESDVSADDDWYRYHVTGSELWDSFWQANSTDDEAQGSAPYPALIPSPAVRRHQTRPSEDRVLEEVRDEEITPCRKRDEVAAWPLPANTESPQSKTPRPARPAAYSLFPAPQNMPSRPAHPPRKSSLTQTQTRSPLPSRAQRASNMSLPTLRRSRPGPLELSDPVYIPKSAPPSPLLSPGQPTGSHFFVSPPPSSSSRPTTSHSHTRKPSSTASIYASKSTVNLRARSASSVTVATLRPFPPVPKPLSSAPPTTTTFSTKQQPRDASPPRISVFEFDSDSESEREGGLARRIVRGLTHKRSQSDSRKTPKGAEVAKDELKRARAGTTAGLPAPPVVFVHHPERAEVPEAKEKEKPRLKRQHSDVFKMLTRWSH